MIVFNHINIKNHKKWESKKLYSIINTKYLRFNSFFVHTAMWVAKDRRSKNWVMVLSLGSTILNNNSPDAIALPLGTVNS